MTTPATDTTTQTAPTSHTTPDGGAEVIRDRAGWESWFVQLFAQLDAMDAATDTLVSRYDRWIEARWHASLLETELPAGFGLA